VEILDVMTTYRKSNPDPVTTIITIPDIQSEEKKDLLIKITLPSVSGPCSAQELLEATLEYDNLISKSVSTEALTVTVSRPDADSKELVGLMTDLEIDEQRNRINTAAAIKKAGDLADGGKLEEARNTIQKATEAINTSSTANRQYCQGLVGDMFETMQGLTDARTYENYGSKAMKSCSSGHFQQRSNDARKKVYQTKAKAGLGEKFRAFRK
jgi:hypothetical protein